MRCEEMREYQQERKAIFSDVLKILKEHDGKLTQFQLIGLLQVDRGLSEINARGIVKALFMSGKVIEENRLLRLTPSEERSNS